MNPQEHAAFTQSLSAALHRRPEVLGLILLGSTAGTHHQADQHSDHDFFVIVPEVTAQSTARSTAQSNWPELYRATLDWLPPRDVPIVHHHRDTAHGARVIYADGHLLEYAVFTPAELPLSRNHHARIAFDRLGDLPARLEPTLEAPLPEVRGLLSDFFLHVLIGVGRHQRGEVLAGQQFLHFAGQDTLGLLRALYPSAAMPAPAAPLHDARNPWRRVEQTHPEQAQALAELLRQPTPQAALGLLRLVRQWAATHPHWNEALALAVELRAGAVGESPGEKPSAL